MITSTSFRPSSHVGEDPHAHLFQAARQQRVRADGAHFRHAQRGQRMDVRTRHAAVQDVADDGHAQVGEILLVVADGVHVEQALGRVRMAAVAGVDHVDMRSGRCRSGAWRSGRARPTAHGAPRTCRHAWPPGCRWCRAATRPCWSTEAGMFRLMTSADRRLEAISKVVRVRVEFSKNRLNTLLPRISGTFLTSRSRDADEARRGVEDVVDDRLGQAFDGQQVLQLAVFVQLRIMHGSCLRS